MSAQSVIPTELRVLLLEDDPHDAEIIGETLAADGIMPTLTAVQTEAEFVAALQCGQLDLILADYRLPSFDGMSALITARRLAPTLPFIFVSGTIGEEVAIESLKRGATDYVLKQRLSRLVPAVRRALREVAEEAERTRADLIIHEQAALLDQVQDAICVWDLGGCLQYWNEGAERLYGWTKEYALQQNVDRLLYREENPQLKHALSTTMTQGHWSGELVQVSKTGQEVIVQSRWKLMRNRAGTPLSVLVANTDVTEKKKVEAQFLRAQRLESVGRLASGIAHDLNNVLTPILMAVPMLRKEIKKETKELLLTTVETSALRGADIVKKVLTAGDGTEALSLYAQKQTEIRAVLTDAMMPFLNGPSTIRALRKMNPAVKVILMTGFSPETKLEAFPPLATQAFLQKPFTSENLLQTLHQVLRDIPPAKVSG